MQLKIGKEYYFRSYDTVLHGKYCGERDFNKPQNVILIVGEAGVRYSVSQDKLFKNLDKACSSPKIKKNMK